MLTFYAGPDIGAEVIIDDDASTRMRLCDFLAVNADNEDVQDAVAALERGELATFGGGAQAITTVRRIR